MRTVQGMLGLNWSPRRSVLNVMLEGLHAGLLTILSLPVFFFASRQCPVYRPQHVEEVSSLFYLVPVSGVLFSSIPISLGRRAALGLYVVAAFLQSAFSLIQY